MDFGDLALWAIGILISVLLAFVGGRWVIKRRSQNAKASGSSTIIQSGRDTRL